MLSMPTGVPLSPGRLVQAAWAVFGIVLPAATSGATVAVMVIVLAAAPGARASKVTSTVRVNGLELLCQVPGPAIEMSLMSAMPRLASSVSWTRRS